MSDLSVVKATRATIGAIRKAAALPTDLTAEGEERRTPYVKPRKGGMNLYFAKYDFDNALWDIYDTLGMSHRGDSDSFANVNPIDTGVAIVFLEETLKTLWFSPVNGEVVVVMKVVNISTQPGVTPVESDTYYVCINHIGVV